MTGCLLLEHLSLLVMPLAVTTTGDDMGAGSVGSIEMTESLICDLDGTLVDVSGLRDWVTGKRKDFHQFHTLSRDAPPIAWVVQEVQDRWDRGDSILLVTARNEAYRASTIDWLAEHNVPWDQLYMRKLKDFRPDREVKSDILTEIRLSGYDPIVAYDDNPSVIELWKENNMIVVEVPGWEQ